jgi:hypothetical protein
MAKQKTTGKIPAATDHPEQIPFVRRFALIRTKDVSGMSGSGVVAVGSLFPDGLCFLSWTISALKSYGIYNSVADLEALHGHDGGTTIKYLD